MQHMQYVIPDKEVILDSVSLFTFEVNLSFKTFGMTVTIMMVQMFELSRIKKFSLNFFVIITLGYLSFVTQS